MPETVQLAKLELKDLSTAIMASRTRFTPEADLDPTDYVKLWHEEESWKGEVHKAITVVLRTRGCTWDYNHGCTMCGYFNETAHKKITAEQLLAQWQRVQAQTKDETILKIYTGGNFLDVAEVMDNVQRTIVSEGSKRFKLIMVESRPEYCTQERLSVLAKLAAENGGEIMIAIGLESSSDEVCDKAINKGYAFKEFVEAANNCRATGVRVKTYFLLKPPFLTEDETVEDIVQSVRDAAPYSDILSVNPTNVQKFTLVENLWKEREFRSPWLWSVLEVVRRAKPFSGTAVLKSDPVGGGGQRGAHNCGKCDERILGHIENYNKTQDVAFIEAAERIDCSCKPLYRTVRRLEGYLVGSAFTGPERE
jgi:archaeosine synthase beta-subunit